MSEARTRDGAAPRAPETVADIVAAMRQNLEKRRYYGTAFHLYADRIEAASKRERENAAKTAMMAKCEICAKIGPAVVGNAAALRDALEAMVAFWDIHGGAYSVRVFPVRDNPEEVEAERVSVMARGKAALAAPPRNCDRFATLKDAQEAFFPCHLPCYTQTRVGAFLDWLFAPAAPKGGDHADA